MGKEKIFGVSVYVKSRTEGAARRSGKSYRGIVTASSPMVATELTKRQFFNTFKGLDPPVLQDDILVKECFSYNDFVIKEK